jgi:hypothetical protein
MSARKKACITGGSGYIVLAMNLPFEQDFIGWSLNQNKIFSTKSVYKWLEET